MALVRAGAQHLGDALEDRSLAALHRHAEGVRDQAQQVLTRDLRGHDARHAELVGIELAAHPLDQRGLARADLAGDDDEALALVQPVGEMGVRALMHGAVEEQPRVGRHLERVLAEPVILEQHDADPSPTPVTYQKSLRSPTSSMFCVADPVPR
jgi:hypothetical protein